ncbi:MAG: Tad domain-containing protein [Hyphomicrobiales bacterium]|nr:Tad domain-containing protein [Hyphomicrobiales bacterium]
MVIAAVPLMLAVGLATDYSLSVETHSGMQNALDASTQSLTTLPRTDSDADRLKKLQDDYEANGGQGTAVLEAYDFDADGTLHVKTSASYDMPTSFMKLAHVDDVSIGVSSGIEKSPSLVEATFKIDKASGYWNKTISLYGTKFKEKDAKPLMKIEYQYNGGGGDKGYGTTTVLTPDNEGNFTKIAQKQVCTTTDYKKKNMVKGMLRDGDKMTACEFTVGDGSGAPIDVSQMDGLYLQMDVPSGRPNVLKSDDPNTSDRLFIDSVEVPTGRDVDIFTAVPCGETSSQAWEDGGSPVPGPVDKADFFYSVTGKCNYSQRVAQTRFTR